nr:GH25 family lysozyme [uncultured Ralstonia sp.]
MRSSVHGGLPRLLRGLLISMACVLTSAMAQVPEFSGTCPNGAPARKEIYCRFFVHFNNDTNAKLDTRIADAVGVKTAAQTRAIGLIIVNDKYPNLPGHDLPAAAVDGDNLVRFLVEKQKFDELIVLRNLDATVDNINYFLEDYLPNRASDFDKKARLLIAYSGHGRYGKSDGSTDTRAAFVLSAASDVGGSSNVYKMQDLASDIEVLAGRYFHVLTLINACYGGGFFTSGSPGGNADSFRKPGSYALTAGSSDDLVPALDPKRGSLFFDLLISGITQGSADPLYWDAYSTVSGDGSSVHQSGLTRTLALATYLTSAYARIARERATTDLNFHLSDPWIGPAQTGIAWGGFFFLSDRGSGPSMAAANVYGGTIVAATAPPAESNFGFLSDTVRPPAHLRALAPRPSSDRAAIAAGAASRAATPPTPPPPPATNAAELSLPPGPVSSIVGHPDIKVFKAPDIYPVQGYDLSSADGKINWEVFSNTTRPRFIYARAIGWSGPDETFDDRWAHIKALGIDYGAYLKYDFCRSPKDQMTSLSGIVPVDQNALPFAIEVVNPKGENERQLSCFNAMGLEKAKDSILELASYVRAHYNKTPLLYGNRNNLSTFVDKRADDFMIWLGSYGASGIQLRGSNPWTLWQYSGTLDVKGVGPKTTGQVFFGTEEQYLLFKRGQANVALKAVKQ